MRKLLIAAALLACACTPPNDGPSAPTAEPQLPGVTLPVVDRAGNRMEALTQTGARWCTSDSVWCIEGANVTVSFMPGTPAIALPGEGDIWPVVVRSGESALVGLITTDSTPYSGGSGSAQHLTLYEVASGAAREVLRMPYSGECGYPRLLR